MKPIHIAIVGLLTIASIAVSIADYLIEEERRQTKQQIESYQK
jgi:hypothetical protein